MYLSLCILYNGYIISFYYLWMDFRNAQKSEEKQQTLQQHIIYNVHSHKVFACVLDWIYVWYAFYVSEIVTISWYMYAMQCIFTKCKNEGVFAGIIFIKTCIREYKVLLKAKVLILRSYLTFMFWYVCTFYANCISRPFSNSSSSKK